jgi:hypothetical protein
MRVALKYCGGCSSTYDRTDYVRRIQHASAGRIEWVGVDDDDYGAILLICGCDAVCIEDEMPRDVRLVRVKNDHVPVWELVDMLLDDTGPDESK